MSYTTQAFIHKGTWSSETRAHPALNFIEHYQDQVFDQQHWKTDHYSDWHTHDYTFTKPDGNAVSGRHEAWTDGHGSTFGGFSGHAHEPHFIAIWETQDGWEATGEADLYGDLAAGGEEAGKVKDRSGKEWHAVLHVAYHCELVKSEGGEGGNKFGILIKSARMYTDAVPAIGAKLRSGVIKKEDLGH